jgi:hypothetical protein
MTTQLDKYIERLKQADQLIRMRATGKPSDFAAKLQVCKSHLFNILEDLRDLGLPLAYCREECTYYYERPSLLQIKINVVLLDEQESNNIIAGSKLMLNLHQSNFIRLPTPTLAIQ